MYIGYTRKDVYVASNLVGHTKWEIVCKSKYKKDVEAAIKELKSKRKLKKHYKYKIEQGFE